ncbi:MAG: SDR family NAD(P)-dependent oxidoreductase [Gemmatimonadota bacterium]
MIDLTGQVSLVTGGSRGIGRATALLLARAGADVAVGYRSRQADAEAVAAEIRQLGRRALLAAGDLGDEARAAEVVATVMRAFGRLDILVANAGTWPPEDVPVSRLDTARWRDTVRDNLDGVFYVTRAALRVMAPGGRVILVSSTAGQRGEAGHADYAATKGGVIALTRSLAVECAPDVTVNCVAPGWVATEMSAGALAGDRGEAIARSIPLRRVATPEDVAGPIVFLASPLARHMTGAILNVNGGSVL